jgi:hypothetical protein
MIAGDDLIRGELWHLRPEDMRRTLDALDVIEGCVEGTGDQYERIIIECHDENGQSHRAYAYHFVHSHQLKPYPVLTVGPNGYCEWPPTKG